MAIYHLTANIISRARGQSVVAAVAYRAGAVLRDERYGVMRDYRGKRAAAHAEIMAPAGTPMWARDREVLWNRVEAAECRKDSQLARVIEIGLPIELSAEQCVGLIRDYIEKQFVAKGMIADFYLRGETHNPHAHILLTLRGVTAAGFGPKERRWNGKSMLLEWRSAWAIMANEHLARAGHAVRIDHRTLEAQQIELTPARRIGAGCIRPGALLPDHLADRIVEQQRIAMQNGATILEDPTVALSALTQQRPTFTSQELSQFLRSRTGSPEQFDATLLAVTQCEDLVALNAAADGSARFTSRDMVEAERSLMRRAVLMAVRRGHGVPFDLRNIAASQFSFSEGQRCAFDYVTSDGDAKAIAVCNADKSALLAAAHHAWYAAGWVAGSVIAQNLAALEASRASVLVAEDAHLLGIKQLERILAVADHARAMVVLVGDRDQMSMSKIPAPFRDVLREIGFTNPPL